MQLKILRFITKILKYDLANVADEDIAQVFPQVKTMIRTFNRIFKKTTLFQIRNLLFNISLIEVTITSLNIEICIIFLQFNKAKISVQY